MKKVLVMLLAALSIFALASCGGNDEAAENDNAVSYTHLDVYKRQLYGLPWQSPLQYCCDVSQYITVCKIMILTSSALCRKIGNMMKKRREFHGGVLRCEIKRKGF